LEKPREKTRHNESKLDVPRPLTRRSKGDGVLPRDSVAKEEDEIEEGASRGRRDQNGPIICPNQRGKRGGHNPKSRGDGGKKNDGHR